jgi:hypothetical protein
MAPYVHFLSGCSSNSDIRSMQPINCDMCGRLTPSYDIVNYGSMNRGYRQLCSRCFNAEVVELGGLDEFEHVQFEPVVLTDLRPTQALKRLPYFSAVCPTSISVGPTRDKPKHC